MSLQLSSIQVTVTVLLGRPVAVAKEASVGIGEGVLTGVSYAEVDGTGAESAGVDSTASDSAELLGILHFSSVQVTVTVLLSGPVVVAPGEEDSTSTEGKSTGMSEAVGSIEGERVDVARAVWI